MHMKILSWKIAVMMGLLTVGCGLSGDIKRGDGRGGMDGEPVCERPPMGWNSFDAFDCAINEQQFRAEVDYMAEHLKDYGWEYAVIDYVWYNPAPGNWGNPSGRYGHPDLRLNPDDSPIDRLVMDEYGRLLPAVERFPSAAGGRGFGPLADYVHSKGLKFGIHIMRGLPAEAWFEDLPILDSEATARDIGVWTDLCRWNNNMIGVAWNKPGAQAYYNSLFALYASWGVDFVKADDTMYPIYHQGEIELMHQAIEQCGRPMVLSLSCGEAPIEKKDHLRANANMWRISGDFWDNWKSLYHGFELAERWSGSIEPNHWPDGDMLPIGHLSIGGRPHGADRESQFSWDEYQTLMTLWCMARSPLMMGGDLLTSSQRSLSYLTNSEVLYVNQESEGNRQLFRRGDRVCWIGKDSRSDDWFAGLFNLGERPVEVGIDFSELGEDGGEMRVRDLWQRSDLGVYQGGFSVRLGRHESGMYRLSRQEDKGL